MVNVAIVDDEEEIFKQIENCLLRFAGCNEDVDFNIQWFSNAFDFLENYQSADIVFMDIEMPVLNGMEAAEKLRATGSTIPLVFVTNMAQYAIKGYSVNAIDYVLKPVNYTRFAALLKKILRIVNDNKEVELYLKVAGGTKRISASDILYVEIRNHLLVYHTICENIETWGTMKDAEKALPETFVRCNHAYIVNLKYVTSVKNDDIIIEGNQLLPISRSKKKDFMLRFNRYIGQK